MKKKPRVARWLGLICIVAYMLCVGVRMYVVATDKDTPSVCNRGQFFTGGKLFWGAFWLGAFDVEPTKNHSTIELNSEGSSTRFADIWIFSEIPIHISVSSTCFEVMLKKIFFLAQGCFGWSVTFYVSWYILALRVFWSMFFLSSRTISHTLQRATQVWVILWWMVRLNLEHALFYFRCIALCLWLEAGQMAWFCYSGYFLFQYVILGSTLDY